jgi:hypothetical protein
MATDAASQSMPKPWQASAWMPTMVSLPAGRLGAGADFDVCFSCPCDEQQAAFVVQLDFLDCVAQQLSAGGLSGITLNATSKSDGGETPWARAQATRSAQVWQQQLSQHC